MTGGDSSRQGLGNLLLVIAVILFAMGLLMEFFPVGENDPPPREISGPDIIIIARPGNSHFWNCQTSAASPAEPGECPSRIASIFHQVTMASSNSRAKSSRSKGRGESLVTRC
jgi:hypothetical protein